MKTSVPYAFTYETNYIVNKDGESAELRVDLVARLEVSKNYGGFQCGAIDSFDVLEITDLDAKKDITYLKSMPLIKDEIMKHLEKNEQYLVDKSEGRAS